MRLPWSKPKADQLELLDADPKLSREPSVLQAIHRARSLAPPRSSKTAAEGDVSSAGRPLLVPLDRLTEDPNNPRTKFPKQRSKNWPKASASMASCSRWSCVLATRPGAIAFTTARSAVVRRGVQA
jgi:hypothetical protein